MRFFRYQSAGKVGLGIRTEPESYGLLEDEAGYPGDLPRLLEGGTPALQQAADRLTSAGKKLNSGELAILPPFPSPSKIICVGLNYADHSAESGFNQPDYPTLFARFNSGLVAHGSPLIRPRLSHQLDYEGELASIIGKRGRNIPVESALDHVAGYSIFNDGSVRDYQTKGPQWTVGKNFDGTGGFGPDFVTSDELPPGAKGLNLQTRLNSLVVQNASTGDMVFDVATLINVISQAISLEVGDVIVTGTPAGIGLARNPQLWMKHGDVCEVEIERIGILRNHIVDEESLDGVCQVSEIATQ
jgi:acylpyruvate hydrolase